MAFSTASPALSLALFDAGALAAHRHAIIGRGHAEAIVPAIAALIGDAPPDAIIVDIGPGSFTGIRIGIAAARALGLAWSVPVTGCSGAALVAAAAFARDPDLAAVTVRLDAGRGQAFSQHITADFDGSAIETLPADQQYEAGCTAFAGPLAPPSAIHFGHPDAADVLRLPAAQRRLAAEALYVRPPDAILPL